MEVLKQDDVFQDARSCQEQRWISWTRLTAVNRFHFAREASPRSFEGACRFTIARPALRWNVRSYLTHSQPLPTFPAAVHRHLGGSKGASAPAKVDGGPQLLRE